MIINFFPNDGCAIVYCISRISLLYIKLIFFLKKSPLLQFEIAFNDISIFLTPLKGVEDICFFVEKNPF